MNFNELRCLQEMYKIAHQKGLINIENYLLKKIRRELKMSYLKEALTKKLVKEYQTRLRKMCVCGKDTEDNRLALYKEFSRRCAIKVTEATQLTNGIYVNEIIEKYQDTFQKRDKRSTEEVF